MTDLPKWIRFETAEALYRHAAVEVERIAADSVRARGTFHLALAGGRTPVPLYRRLAVSTVLDWSAIHLFWSDERCVAPTAPESNYLAATALLRHVPIPPERVHRIRGELDPLTAADAYEITLRRVLGANGRLDLILLGLGADGHTASLFPRHQALTEAERWFVPVHAPAEPPWRVTMTLPMINATRDVLFLISGPAKAPAVRAVEAGEPLPASLVRPMSGHVTFLVDAEAASLLH